MAEMGIAPGQTQTSALTNARHSDRRPQPTGRLLLQPDEAAKEKSATDR
jgi:hypothetical protein